jgi:hypothetical protein
MASLLISGRETYDKVFTRRSGRYNGEKTDDPTGPNTHQQKQFKLPFQKVKRIIAVNF